MAEEGVTQNKQRHFGEVAGFAIGALFTDRASLAKSGVHKPTQAGISGSGNEGADSIVVSGGYEDDEDFGDEIIYTGHGGNDPNTKKQIADQELTRGNLALAKSKLLGLPVRVVRGANHKSPYAPKSGFRIYRFRLIREQRSVQETATSEVVSDSESLIPKRVETTTLRIVRDTRQAKAIKELYDDTCQFCGVRLETPAGPYAEAAHIRPLGSPHHGPDSLSNLLCQYPNHHVLFDAGAIVISENLELHGITGKLYKAEEHSISLQNIEYHRTIRGDK